MRIQFLLTLCFAFSLIISAAHSATTTTSKKKFVSSGKYVINLISTKGQLHTSGLQNLDAFNNYHLYRTVINYKNSQWKRLRLGFFESRDEALEVLEKVKPAYPRAWVTTVTDTERTASASQGINLSSPIKPQNSLAVIPPGLASLNTKKTPKTVKKVKKNPQSIKPTKSTRPTKSTQPSQVKSNNKPVRVKSSGKQSILQQARDAMTARDYSRAVQLTTYLLNTPGASDKQEALELLGLARERNKQYAHAKAEYEKYLSLYPESEDTTRVRQRLAGLITAYEPVKVAQLEKTKNKKASKAADWQHIGSLSQYYYRNEISNDTDSNLVSNSLLISTLDTTSRLRTDDYNHRIQLTTDNQYSFLDGESVSHFRNLYYELVDRTVRNSFRIGRQTYDSSGVFGRFDGIVAGLEMSKFVNFSAAGGNLIGGNDILEFDQSKKFISGNFNIGTIANKWDFNVYGITQTVDNITDRKAFGTEIRYFEPNFNVFSLLDYDVHFNELNTLIFNSNWVFPDTSTLFANIDIRKSPYISTSNAIQGQTEQSIAELLNTYTEAEIKQLAIDRTAQINTFTFGGTLAMNSVSRDYGEYRVSLDTTITNTSGTPASGGVAETEPTGNQYFLNAQIIGSSIFSRGDTNILFFRTGFSKDASDYTFGLNSRFQIYKVWRLNPIIQYNNRNNKRNNSTRKLSRVVLRVENRFQSNILFESELGMDYESDDAGGVVQKSDTLFFHIGYRIDF